MQFDTDISNAVSNVILSSARYDKKLYDLTNQALQKGLLDGFGTVSTNLNSVDFLRLANFESNIIRFSAAKTTQQMLALNVLKNKARDVNDFINQAKAVSVKYNETWLRAEYNTATSASQNAADYFSQIAAKELFPYLIYDTVGDSRVRDSHKNLEGTVIKAGSKLHNMLTPPLGFNCRCRLKPYTGTADVVEEKLDKVVAKISSDDYKIFKKYGFDQNPATTLEIFSKKQFYIADFKETALNYKDYFKNDLRSSISLPTIDKTNWFNSKIGTNDLTNTSAIRLLDYKKRPIILQAKNLDIVPEDALKSPDEVWMFKNNNTYTYNYLKAYFDKVLLVEVQLSTTNEANITKTVIKTVEEANNVRKGILIN
jgi:SPP1 gp7 family putative phage head morphogenesis protein